MNKIARQILKRLKRPATLAGERLPDEFVLPAYDGYSLANVPATVLSHFGVKGFPTPPLAQEALGDQLKGCRKLVVLLMDALGFLAAQKQMAEDRGLALNTLARKGRFVPLTSVFPSTTAVAISTLHTGLPPTGHGITGYRMYLPERGFIANMIRLSPESDERPTRLLRYPGDGEALLGVPTVHTYLKRAGIPSTCLIRDAISRSGLSQMLYDGATRVVPFVSSSDMFVQIRKLVETDPEEPACIWAYWGALDTILHNYGTDGREPEAELRSFCFSLQEELLRPLGGRRGSRAGLLFMSDHGHVGVEAQDVISVPRFKRLRDELRLPPTGTGRSSYLYLNHGCTLESRAYMRKALGDRAVVLSSRDALRGGLWGPGPIRPDVNERIGDLLLLTRQTNAFFYPYWKGAAPSDLVGGRHGGLSQHEMLIPLFCCRL